MIIIPEKKVVLITPPRTGSTFLKELIPEFYPQAFQPYRHMEADGVPHGYDNWRRVGVFRPALERLWSVYNWCLTLPHSDRGTPEWRRKVYRSVNVGFEHWLLNNNVVFTDPYDSATDEYHPKYSVMHPMPENLKSLRRYIRPDLGTEVMLLPELLQLLDISNNHAPRNSAFSNGRVPPPKVTPDLLTHLQAFHGWDLIVERNLKGE